MVVVVTVVAEGLMLEVGVASVIVESSDGLSVVGDAISRSDCGRLLVVPELVEVDDGDGSDEEETVSTGSGSLKSTVFV